MRPVTPQVPKGGEFVGEEFAGSVLVLAGEEGDRTAVEGEGDERRGEEVVEDVAEVFMVVTVVGDGEAGEMGEGEGRGGSVDGGGIGGRREEWGR